MRPSIHPSVVAELRWRIQRLEGGAVAVASIGVTTMRRMTHPVLADALHVPVATVIDVRLLLGSAIFGIGWGIAGFCPGPALAALSSGLWPVAAFVIAMGIGMVAHDRVVPPVGH